MIDIRRLKNRYYVMRHGQSLANVRGIIVSSPENGLSGYGLSRTGRSQARQAVDGFPDLDRHTLIYASDFLRTRETAQIAAGCLDTDTGITFTPLLRERFFGDWELTPDKNYDRVWADDARHPPVTSGNVEPVESVLERGIACVAGIEEQHSDRTVLLVAHGDTLQILLTFFKGWSPHRHRELPPLAVARIRAALA